MRKTGLFLASIMCASVSFAGGSLDISLKNEMAKVEHEAIQVGTGALISVGGAYTETNEYMASVGLTGIDASNQNSELLGGVGVKAYVWDVDETHLSAAVGGFARYTPDYMNGMGLEASMYYSPSIISFMGAESFQEVLIRVNYKVMPQARIFLGYHDISGTIEGGARKTVDSGYHLGFRMNY